MFRREAAAKVLNDILDRFQHPVLQCRIVAGGKHREMQVSVPQMGHGQAAQAGVKGFQTAQSLGQERFHPVKWQADVGIDGRGQPDHVLGCRLTPRPHRPALLFAARKDRVLNQPLIQQLGKDALKKAHQRHLALIIRRGLG